MYALLSRQHVVSRRACTQLTSILQAAATEGTGGATFKNAKNDKKVAGKTGTSDEYKDCWFAGYTNTLTCVLWIGRDDSTPMGDMYTGAGIAAPLWSTVVLGDATSDLNVTGQRAQLERRNALQTKRTGKPIGSRRSV